MQLPKKFTVILTFLGVVGAANILAQNKEGEHHEQPQNLKVLPKRSTDEEVHAIMRVWSRSLGVRCNYCHAVQKGATGDKPRLDFASDEKEEKEIARDMYRMVGKINGKYLDKMGNHQLAQISCVTCHMGRVRPIVSVDSLAKQQ